MNYTTQEKEFNLGRIKESIYFNSEVWRATNDIIHENVESSDVKIVFSNIEDSCRFPNELKFLALDWEHLRVLVYREPTLRIYTFKSYSDLVKSILKNKDKLASEGVRTMQNTELNRIKLLSEIEKPHKIKSLKHGEEEIKIGDVFYTCWGYDQTNTEFFILKRIIGKNYLIMQELCGVGGCHNHPYGEKRISERLEKKDIPIKAFFSDDGRVSLSEYGYKRGLYKVKDLNQTFIVTER